MQEGTYLRAPELMSKGTVQTPRKVKQLQRPKCGPSERTTRTARGPRAACPSVLGSRRSPPSGSAGLRGRRAASGGSPRRAASRPTPSEATTQDKSINDREEFRSSTCCGHDTRSGSGRGAGRGTPTQPAISRTPARQPSWARRITCGRES